MTKAAFVSGLQTERHCDVQGSSAHIRVFVGGHESRLTRLGLSSRERWDEWTEQINSFGLVPFALFVFPIIPWFTSAHRTWITSFFCDLMC